MDFLTACNRLAFAKVPFSVHYAGTDTPMPVVTISEQLSSEQLQLVVELGAHVTATKDFVILVKLGEVKSNDV